MNERGMTKIELLIVATIMGVLGSVAVLTVMDARAEMRDAVRLSDVRQIQVGLELSFHDFNAYPEALDSLGLGRAATSCLNQNGFVAVCDPSIDALYIEQVPQPPKEGLNGVSTCGDSSGYCYLGFGDEYRVSFELEKNHSSLGLRKGLNCATEYGFESGPCEDLSTTKVLEVTEE